MVGTSPVGIQLLKPEAAANNIVKAAITPEAKAAIPTEQPRKEAAALAAK
jgi:hypothetical protein